MRPPVEYFTVRLISNYTKEKLYITSTLHQPTCYSTTVNIVVQTTTLNMSIKATNKLGEGPESITSFKISGMIWVIVIVTLQYYSLHRFYRPSLYNNICIAFKIQEISEGVALGHLLQCKILITWDSNNVCEYSCPSDSALGSHSVILQTTIHS